MVVGRHRDCDIILPYGFVSKHHCELEWQDGAWSVRDLDSLHGIGVNGATCSRNRLEPGSILSIASLRYQLVSSESGPSRATVKGPSLVFGQSLLEKAGLAHWQPGSTAGGKGKADDDQGRQRYTLDLEGS
jgi:pSer/pThr/pTyr-binding forkhead associated (FHA) protein